MSAISKFINNGKSSYEEYADNTDVFEILVKDMFETFLSKFNSKRKRNVEKINHIDNYDTYVANCVDAMKSAVTSESQVLSSLDDSFKVNSSFEDVLNKLTKHYGIPSSRVNGGCSIFRNSLYYAVIVSRIIDPSRIYWDVKDWKAFLSHVLAMCAPRIAEAKGLEDDEWYELTIAANLLNLLLTHEATSATFGRLGKTTQQEIIFMLCYKARHVRSSGSCSKLGRKLNRFGCLYNICAHRETDVVHSKNFAADSVKGRSPQVVVDCIPRIIPQFLLVKFNAPVCVTSAVEHAAFDNGSNLIVQPRRECLKVMQQATEDNRTDTSEMITFQNGLEIEESQVSHDEIRKLLTEMYNSETYDNNNAYVDENHGCADAYKSLFTQHFHYRNCKRLCVSNNPFNEDLFQDIKPDLDLDRYLVGIFKEEQLRDRVRTSEQKRTSTDAASTDDTVVYGWDSKRLRCDTTNDSTTLDTCTNERIKLNANAIANAIATTKTSVEDTHNAKPTPSLRGVTSSGNTHADSSKKRNSGNCGNIANTSKEYIRSDNKFDNRRFQEVAVNKVFARKKTPNPDASI